MKTQHIRKATVLGSITILGVVVALRPVRAQQTRQASPVCAGRVEDKGTGACLEASSVPMLGKLYPLSPDLFVDPSGLVGLGTTSPDSRLDVEGRITVDPPGGANRVVLQATDTGAGAYYGEVRTIGANGTFNCRMYASNTAPNSGIVETIGPDGLLTTLLSSQTVNPTVGTISTWNDSAPADPNIELTSPLLAPSAGLLNVYNNGVVVGGIDGDTGCAFGAVKCFIQPHPSDATREIRYVALEGPENGVYFRGTARLDGGRVRIEVPEDFRLVALEDGLTVQLTPLGPSRGLFVALKGLSGIVVQENQGGKGDVEFDYHVMGLRSALPPHVVVHPNEHFTPRPGTEFAEGSLPGNYRELMIRNGTLFEDGTVNESTAGRLGWRLGANGWEADHVTGIRGVSKRRE